MAGLMFFGNGLSHLYTDNKEKVPSAPLGLAHLYYGSEVPHTASTLSDPQIQQVDHSLVNAQKPHRIESQGNSIPGTSASMIHRPLKRTSSQIQESEGKKVKKEHNATSSSPSSAQSFLEWTKEADQSFHRALFGNEKSLTTLAHLPPAQRRRGSIFPERRTSVIEKTDLPSRASSVDSRSTSPLTIPSDWERTPSPGPSDPTYSPPGKVKLQPNSRKDGHKKPSRDAGQASRRRTVNSDLISTQVAGQVEAIFKGTEDDVPRYTLQEFFQMVSQRGYNSTGLKREAEAIRRIVVGYVKVLDGDIATAFLPLSQLPSSSSSCVDTAINLHQIADACDRMIQRERLLFRTVKRDDPGTTIFTWLTNLLIHNIEAIEMVNEYDLEVKQKFRETTMGEDFGYLDYIMGRRRHFRSLYQEFGATVLLDPVLLSYTERNFPRGTKWLHGTIESVLQRMKGKKKDQNFYSNNREFLLGVVGMLGGSNFETYVEIFLNRSQCR